MTTRGALRSVVVLGHFPELATLLEPAIRDFVLVTEDEAPSDPSAAHYRSVVTVPAMSPDVIADAARNAASGSICAVLAGRERYTVLSAEVGRRLHVQPADPSLMEIFENKAAFRAAVHAAGLGTYPYVVPEVPGDVLALLAQSSSGAVVVKPIRGNASRGVRLIDISDGGAELNRIVGGCLAGKVVAEEYVPGRGYSVEVVRSGGHVDFWNITEKIMPGDPLTDRWATGSPFVPVGHRVPARISKELTSDLVTRTNRLLAHVGADNGLFHAEWQVPTVGPPHFVECAARLPGGDIAAAVHAAYGVNLAEAWISALTGARSPRHDLAADGPDREQVRHVACVAFTADHAGTLRGYHGLDVVESRSTTIRVTRRAVPGDTVGHALDGTQRLLFVVVGADSAEDVDRLVAEVLDAVTVDVVADGDPGASACTRP